MGRACDVMEQASSEIRSSKVLFLSHINFLKHLEGLGLVQPAQEVGQGSKLRHFTTRATAVFERALFDSELGAADKKDVALAYLDYMRETAGNVAQIKAVEAKIIDAKLLEAIPASADDNALPEGGSILGKRQRTK